MASDWNKLDFEYIRDQTGWICQCHDTIVQTSMILEFSHKTDMVNEVQEEFKKLLNQNTSIELWIQWLQEIVHRILSKCVDTRELIFNLATS